MNTYTITGGDHCYFAETIETAKKVADELSDRLKVEVDVKSYDGNVVYRTLAIKTDDKLESAEVKAQILTKKHKKPVKILLKNGVYKIEYPYYAANITTHDYRHGRNVPVIYKNKCVRAIIRNQSVLDYGCGESYKLAYDNEYYGTCCWYGYDARYLTYDENMNALSRKYDCVILSNVLDTCATIETAVDILNHAMLYCKHDLLIYVNTGKGDGIERKNDKEFLKVEDDSSLYTLNIKVSMWKDIISDVMYDYPTDYYICSYGNVIHIHLTGLWYRHNFLKMGCNYFAGLSIGELMDRYADGVEERAVKAITKFIGLKDKLAKSKIDYIKRCWAVGDDVLQEAVDKIIPALTAYENNDFDHLELSDISESALDNMDYELWKEYNAINDYLWILRAFNMF